MTRTDDIEARGRAAWGRVQDQREYGRDPDGEWDDLVTLADWVTELRAARAAAWPSSPCAACAARRAAQRATHARWRATPGGRAARAAAEARRRARIRADQGGDP